MNQEEVRILVQYIDAMGEAVQKLEQSYIGKDIENMKKIKIFIKQVQEKISTLISR